MTREIEQQNPFAGQAPIDEKSDEAKCANPGFRPPTYTEVAQAKLEAEAAAKNKGGISLSAARDVAGLTLTPNLFDVEGAYAIRGTLPDGKAITVTHYPSEPRTRGTVGDRLATYTEIKDMTTTYLGPLKRRDEIRSGIVKAHSKG